MFKRIDHVELLTAAPGRVVAFYCDVLGFRERERMRIPETPQGPLDLVYLDLGGTTLEVMTYPEPKAPLLPARPAWDGNAWPSKCRTWMPPCGSSNRTASSRRGAR